MMNKDYWT